MGYVARSNANVTHEPASSPSAPGRRLPASGDRATSFGFDLAARQALARGDREQLARLFDLAFERVHSYIARMVADEHVAEDLVQDSFVRIQRGLATYRPECALRPWLFTIASNVLRDHFAARRQAALDVDALAAEPVDRHDAPSVRLEHSERAAAARSALAALSDQARAVIVLRHFEALSYVEIAAALRISEDTARQRYVRGLAKLRVRLVSFAPEAGKPS
jgi:RNA polymerase sigma-70 factor (ECF subfamily)